MDSVYNVLHYTDSKRLDLSETGAPDRQRQPSGTCDIFVRLLGGSRRLAARGHVRTVGGRAAPSKPGWRRPLLRQGLWLKAARAAIYWTRVSVGAGPRDVRRLPQTWCRVWNVLCVTNGLHAEGRSAERRLQSVSGLQVCLTPTAAPQRERKSPAVAPPGSAVSTVARTGFHACVRSKHGELPFRARESGAWPELRAWPRWPRVSAGPRQLGWVVARFCHSVGRAAPC